MCSCLFSDEVRGHHIQSEAIFRINDNSLAAKCMFLYNFGTSRASEMWHAITYWNGLNDVFSVVALPETLEFRKRRRRRAHCLQDDVVQQGLQRRANIREGFENLEIHMRLPVLLWRRNKVDFWETNTRFCLKQEFHTRKIFWHITEAIIVARM